MTYPPKQYDEQGQYSDTLTETDTDPYSEKWEEHDKIVVQEASENSIETEIRIMVTLVNLDSVSRYNGKARLLEDENGEMIIYKKRGKEYYAVPVESSLNEKDYAYTALKSCFNINPNIQSGCLYAVEVRDDCILEKEEDFYVIKKKGMLQIKKEL